MTKSITFHVLDDSDLDLAIGGYAAASSIPGIPSIPGNVGGGGYLPSRWLPNPGSASLPSDGTNGMPGAPGQADPFPGDMGGACQGGAGGGWDDGGYGGAGGAGGGWDDGGHGCGDGMDGGGYGGGAMDGGAGAAGCGGGY